MRQLQSKISTLAITDRYRVWGQEKLAMTMKDLKRKQKRQIAYDLPQER